MTKKTPTRYLMIARVGEPYPGAPTCRVEPSPHPSGAWVHFSEYDYIRRRLDVALEAPRAQHASITLNQDDIRAMAIGRIFQREHTDEPADWMCMLAGGCDGLPRNKHRHTDCEICQEEIDAAIDQEMAAIREEYHV